MQLLEYIAKISPRDAQRILEVIKVCPELIPELESIVEQKFEAVQSKNPAALNIVFEKEKDYIRELLQKGLKVN
jgi:hypothetical protein